MTKARSNWEKAMFWGRVAVWCLYVSAAAQVVALVCLLIFLLGEAG